MLPSDRVTVMGHVQGRLITLALVGVCTSTASCSSTLRQVRASLERGDQRTAASLAGDDRRALRAVSLAVLAGGLENEATREISTTALLRAKRRARRTLRRLLQNDAPLISTLAAIPLARQGDRRARIIIEKRLAHEQGDIRAAAWRGLGRDDSEVVLARNAIEDVDQRVRSAAIEVLANGLGDTRVVEALAEAARRDPSTDLRCAAIRALSRVTDGDPLLDVARVALRPTSATEIRRAALQALRHTADDEMGLALLEESLADAEPEVRLQAAEILAGRGHREGRNHLLAALSDPTVTIASAAAAAVGQLATPPRDELLLALERPDLSLRLQVAQTLWATGERERSRATLVELIGEEGIIGVRASLELARIGATTDSSRLRLENALENELPEIRALVAEEAASFDDGFELAATALADDDESVRVAAAVTVLGWSRR